METRANINQTYGQPVLTNPAYPPQGVVLNQNTNNMPSPNQFKTTPVALNCIFCKQPVTTKVEKTINVCACLLCYCTGLIFYVCVQACRKKDFCCYDAEHRCPNCGRVLGTYNSC